MFIKEPRPGFVKTRLAVEMGAATAARLYGSWIRLLAQTLQPSREFARLIAVVAGDVDAVRRTYGADFDDYRVQADGDLGTRLDDAMRWALQDGPTVVIGTDCLEIGVSDVETAFAEAIRLGAAIGPASDGGYYLLGLTSFAPRLFSDVRWSSEHTFEDQLRNLRAAGWDPFLLPTRADIDTFADWQAYCARTGREAAS
jgi:hypothetical protein